MKTNRILILFFSILGCVLCYLLQLHFGFTPVTASCITGLLGSFLSFKDPSLSQDLRSVVYVGSFAAMSSTAIFNTLSSSILVGLFSGISYLLLKKHFLGLGGKLGTCAFVGVALYLVIGGIL